VDTFDLTPDPKVLIALTHTPMLPLDALCELIDNSIDAFHAAELQGAPVEHPLVAIELPSASEVRDYEGVVGVRDNGPGLNEVMAERAIRAGYSGNNPYDSLGLFGMGFNISTGKLGRATTFLTAQRDSESAISITMDLDAIRRSGSYRVPFTRPIKPATFVSGTLVEVRGWWPEGNPNNGFIKKLVQYGMPTIRRELGRRYASILMSRRVRISVNGELCQPFEHCVWGDHRFVERKGLGQVPAVYRFNEVVGAQKRCGSCTALISPSQNSCPACQCGALRTVEERVSGWVGIQRYDDATDFGIDLIRRGRAIRVAEKAAFFEYVDEFKKTIRDYPIDGISGRIVGEVHLDHVPVDFLKQDFQRSSPEWQRAMVCLRGESSLQPTQPGADTNTSPVYKLYQGYRRVRRYGRADMYMGYWAPVENEPKRISRDVEQEYLTKFRNRLPGFYEDTEWWKLVEQADQRPVEELVDCTECGAQNLRGHDMCQVCGHILVSKQCINPECGRLVAKSAEVCPHCGRSQIPDIQTPWHCLVCRARNQADVAVCTGCGQSRGTENPISREFLVVHSNKDDELSIAGLSIALADGTYSAAIEVDTYVTTEPIRPLGGDVRIPSVVHNADRFEVFLDKTHEVYTRLGVRPEATVAGDAALYLYDTHRRLATMAYVGKHSLSNLTFAVLKARWGDTIGDTPERVKEAASGFLDMVRERLPSLLEAKAPELFEELTEEQKRNLVYNIMNHGRDVGNIGSYIRDGTYLLSIDDETVVRAIKAYPECFFDGLLWSDPYAKIEGISDSLLADAQHRILSSYLNCLEDLATFLKYRAPDPMMVRRARSSLDILNMRLA
jgi:hypothetical protein